MSFHTIRMFPACAALAATLALTAVPAMAQTIGQAACPDGVTQKNRSSHLVVRGVTHDRATLRGGAPIFTTDINELSDVTGTWPGDWNNATLYFGVRGYGYSETDRDARSFNETIVRVQDGDLVHGAWLHAGTLTVRGLIPSPVTFLSLVPSTKYVAQLVVGELRKGTKVVTNDHVRGYSARGVINPSKPTPVLAQVCFQTAASPS